MDVVQLAGTDPSITQLVWCSWEELLQVSTGLRRNDGSAHNLHQLLNFKFFSLAKGAASLLSFQLRGETQLNPFSFLENQQENQFR